MLCVVVVEYIILILIIMYNDVFFLSSSTYIYNNNRVVEKNEFYLLYFRQLILTRLRKQKPINMSFSQINHNIRRREKPNDVFITLLIVVLEVVLFLKQVATCK